MTIGKETLNEYIDAEVRENRDSRYNYNKINGVKYYYEPTDEDGDKIGWFSIINGERYYTNQTISIESDAAVKYYSEAADFTEWVRENLDDLTTEDAVDENGEHNMTQRFGNYNIFKEVSDNPIEEPDSNFNQHRLAVIRYSIEKNLSIAIANYNNYSGVTANFQMPKLKEDEWDKILNNISIISFLQGLNIGGKVYNGYSIINNTKNQEVVTEDSIYMRAGDYYYKVTEKGLKNKDHKNAILNIDFERKSYIDEEGKTKYFFPQIEYGSYDSIIRQREVNYTDNIYKYLKDLSTEDENGKIIAQKYYTALGRERYSMYRTNNINE